ncbi:MAG: twin transmembrane helix small protein [Phycisphaerales bacterium]|nr:twin transmembrane helix small protein [Phycisphaerales bacterium]
MIFKIIVIVILLMILASLGSGLVFLIRGGAQDNHRLVKALTVRIVLSISLFALLILAYATGLISPHGL